MEKQKEKSMKTWRRMVLIDMKQKSKLCPFNNAHLSSERRHKEPRYVPVCGRVWACVCTGLRVTEIRQSHGIELSSVCYGSV